MISPGIYPLSEGTYTIAGDHVFVPFDSAIHQFKDRPASLLVEIQPFLIVTETDLIIIDPGLGFHLPNGQLHIHFLLSQINIKPQQITKVLLSHLHIDHTGGVVSKELVNGEWQWQPAFPMAIYYFQQQELDYAFEKGSPSYDLEKLSALLKVAKTKALHGDTLIDNFISAEICGGHTPYHQVFKIKTNNGIYFYGGDVVPQFSQVQRKFVAKYDYDGVKAATLRQSYAEEAIASDWTCLFFHDLRTPFCKLKKENGAISKLI